ncbi:MAG: O-antigen ligase family protein [Patescibacteria group bacterium]
MIHKSKLFISYQLLLAAIIFLVPSNLFYKFFESSAYVNGLQIDYLIPKLYLSDIPILIILSLWFFQILKSRIKNPKLKIKSFILLSLVFVFLSYQFLTAKPLASLWYLFKLAEIGCLALFLTKHRKIFDSGFVILALLVSLLFQSLLAIYQFHKQISFSNYLFLGETNLNNYIGLAKGVFNGIEKILPYGSTAHPNILAGFLVIYMLVTSKLIFKSRKYFILYFLFFAPSLYALWLTQSVSAWMALGIGMFIMTTKPKIKLRMMMLIFLTTVFITPLLINQLALKYPQSKSLTRRASLNQSAINVFRNNFMLGVGLNNFTARVEEYSLSRESTRFIQPVHHSGLLILSETGLLGLVIIISAIYLLRQRNQYPISDLACRQAGIQYLTILLPIAALDHYLLTNQTGLLLLAILFAFSSQE